MFIKRLLRNTKWLIGLTTIAALVGCSSGGDGEISAGRGLKTAPSDVAAVYRANCIQCHGAELQGRIGAETDLRKVGARKSAEQITTQIEEGKGLMQPYKDKLTPAEISGLANWLAEQR